MHKEDYIMLRHLLATTAIVAVSGAAMAAEATKVPVVDQRPAQQESMSLHNAAMTGDHLASNLIGETVYSSHSDDAETIGDINDLVVNDQGPIDAVVIGVGGFLGVGEKNVAVQFDSIEWTVDENGSQYAVLTATQEELEAAPAFDTAALEPRRTEDQMASQKPMTDDQMAATDQMTRELQQVDVSTVSANDLINTTVYGAGDENVGEVADVLVADNGEIDAVIIDVGGFLGIGEKPVAIAFEDLMFSRDEYETLYVHTTFTQEQLESAPQYDKSAYIDQRDTMRLTTRG
jgi:sporulation protein YlmC with PRC-barrel domain